MILYEVIIGAIWPKPRLASFGYESCKREGVVEAQSQQLGVQLRVLTAIVRGIEVGSVDVVIWVCHHNWDRISNHRIGLSLDFSATGVARKVAS